MKGAIFFVLISTSIWVTAQEPTAAEQAIQQEQQFRQTFDQICESVMEIRGPLSSDELRFIQVLEDFQNWDNQCPNASEIAAAIDHFQGRIDSTQAQLDGLAPLKAQLDQLVQQIGDLPLELQEMEDEIGRKRELFFHKINIIRMRLVNAGITQLPGAVLFEIPFVIEVGGETCNQECFEVGSEMRKDFDALLGLSYKEYHEQGPSNFIELFFKLMGEGVLVERADLVSFLRNYQDELGLNHVTSWNSNLYFQWSMGLADKVSILDEYLDGFAQYSRQAGLYDLAKLIDDLNLERIEMEETLEPLLDEQEGLEYQIRRIEAECGEKIRLEGYNLRDANICAERLGLIYESLNVYSGDWVTPEGGALIQTQATDLRDLGREIKRSRWWQSRND